MKILIVGSIRGVGDQEKRRTFTAACRALGDSIAKAGHDLIVGSDDLETADKYVVEGAMDALVKQKIWVFRPETSRRRPFNKEQENSKGQAEFFYRVMDSWAAVRVPQLLAADAVILIGGGPATAQAGYVAPVLERPVLAIPCFGGAANDLWESLEPFYERLDPTLKAKIGNLRVDWQSSNAGLAVQILEAALKSGLFRREISPLQLVALFLTSLLLFTGWVWLFVTAPTPHGAIFFSLLSISAFLGTGLRNTLSLLRNSTIRLSLNRVGIELTAGLILAFGLAIVFLIGGFTITGKFDFISSTNQPEDFQRIALAMSTLGFAAGWLIESSSESLKSWLYERLPNREERQKVS